jgi:hypothetical protein
MGSGKIKPEPIFGGDDSLHHVNLIRHKNRLSSEMIFVFRLLLFDYTLGRNQISVHVNIYKINSGCLIQA